jgi:hypothetical protein
MKVQVIVLCLFALIVRAQSRDDIERNYKECKRKLDSLKASNKLFSSEAFPLAIRIKKSMEDAKFSPSFTKRYNELKDNLPLSARVLIWNEKTHIFNKYRSTEYLYAVPNDEAFDSERRRVYTSVPGGRDSNGIWEFTTQDEGKTFLIRNVEYNEYLFSAIDKYEYDSSRRRVFTWRSGTSDDCTPLKIAKCRARYLYLAFLKFPFEFAQYSTILQGTKKYCAVFP